MTVTHIDRYQVLKAIGGGAMGDVYLGHDPKIGRDVAIKLLRADINPSDKLRKRFDREAKAVAALRHPGIVEIYDYGSMDGQLYMVMELIEGANLGTLCRDHGQFPESVLCAVGAELADSLHYAHGQGIIHRDLKPENVFLQEGRLILADFGIAKAFTPENPLGAAAASPYTDIVGTPGFMSPEQLRQEPLDARCDIFALGALLFYLATRKIPFEASSPYTLLQKFREEHPPPITVYRPAVAADLAAIIQDCLAVDRSLRPPSTEIVRRALRRLLDEIGVADGRELLASYSKDPRNFTGPDKTRSVTHLRNKARVAAHDGAQVEARRLHKRLIKLDPSQSVRRITGLRPAAQRQTTQPEVVVQRLTRRRVLATVLGVIVLAGASVGTWFYLREKPSTARSRVSLPTSIVIHTRFAIGDTTHVFVDGKALGTPQSARFDFSPGAHSVELSHPERGHLAGTVTLPQAGAVVIRVNWDKSKVYSEIVE